MCSWSAMTVGTRAPSSCAARLPAFCSATTVPLLRLPEVHEAAGEDDHGPEQGEGPHVRRKMRGAVAVDQREADEVQVDRGRVRLHHTDHPVRLPGQRAAD